MVWIILLACPTTPVLPKPTATASDTGPGSPTTTDTRAGDTGGTTPVDTAPTGDTGEVGEPLRVFATSTTHDGLLGGTAGGDVICNDLARAASLDGNFRAWLSVAGVSVRDRLPGAPVPYERIDGVRVADDFAGFASNGHLATLDRDERGAVVDGELRTWAASNPNGAPSGQDCQGWTTDAASQAGIGGTLDRTDAGWSAGAGGACSQPRRLVCVEMPDDDTVKRVFISSRTYAGDFGGVAGADRACNTLSREAAPVLDGYFRAWLSTSSADEPGSRYRRFSGSYQLTDGSTVARSFADLTDGEIETAIERTEDGSAVGGGGVGNVWTGTNDFGSFFPAANCLDWTIGANAQQGRGGSSSSTTNWSSAVTADCSLQKRIYCVQQ